MLKISSSLLIIMLLLSGCHIAGADVSAQPSSKISTTRFPASETSEELPADASDYPPESEVNKAFSEISETSSVSEDILCYVKNYNYDPKMSDFTAKDREFYTEDPDGVFLYVVPRYTGTSIKIESLLFNSATGEFAANKTVYESIATEDYSLMLLTALPEAGPKIRVTLTCGDSSAIYEPTYNGQGGDSYPIEKIGVFITENIISFAFTAGPLGEEKAVMNIGDEFIGWTLTEIETGAYKSMLAQAHFSGEATLKGDIVVTDGYPLQGLMRFYVSEESQHLLPYSEDDARELWLGFRNEEEAKRMIGENVSKIEDCEIVIKDYSIDLRPMATWNTATLTHIAIDSLGEDYPNFVKIYGDGSGILNDLDCGHLAISDKNELYRIGNTTYKTRIDNVVDATVQSAGYCFLKSDGTLVDVNNNVLAQGVERCDEYSFYRGTGAYTLTREGDEVLMYENALKVWRTGGVSLRFTFVLDTGGDLYYYGAYGEATLLCSGVLDFDVNTASHQSRPMSVYVLDTDNRLWVYEDIRYDESEAMISKIIADNVKRLTVSTVSPYFDALFITESNDLFLYSYSGGAEYVMPDVREISSEAMPVAIKNDGTIWYWGFVPWQPREHVFATPGAPAGETQAEPLMLSMDFEVNADISQKRMEAWLSDAEADPRFPSGLPNKLEALKQYYDYYSTKFRHMYTREELEAYKPEGAA